MTEQPGQISVRDAAAVADASLRGCLRRSASEREQLAADLYARLHPAMGVLGVLFLVLVLAQRPAREGSALQVALLVATWSLWLVFIAEYVLRLVIASDTAAFIRRTWWQLALLLAPVLMLFRALLILRVARPTRVALAAFRGGRSARATLTGRAAWLAVVTAIVVFVAADTLHGVAEVEPYSAALHAAALATITGEPTGSTRGIAQVLDVVLALYAVVFFAALAGIVGAFFVTKGGADGGEPPSSDALSPSARHSPPAAPPDR